MMWKNKDQAEDRRLLSLPPASTNAEFDEFAANYDDALAQGTWISGEGRDYFSRGRVAWLSRCLDGLNEQPRSVLDYGCGTGVVTPFLFDILKVTSLVGVDVSAKSIEMARHRYGGEGREFRVCSEYLPRGQADLVVCHGVFHHIPPRERGAVVDYVSRALRPGGLLALWENNPWNPGTRYIMSRIPFDRNANPLSALEARRLVRAAGFDILRTDFIFIFPRLLRCLRWIESRVSCMPLGAQYQVLCRKPTARN